MCQDKKNTADISTEIKKIEINITPQMEGNADFMDICDELTKKPIEIIPLKNTDC